MKYWKQLIVTATGLILLVAGALPASAATSSSVSGNGFRVSPVSTDLTVNAGSSQGVPLYIENVTNTPETLSVVANDFVANTDESGAPSLLLNGQSASSHGLKQYIELSATTISLQPGEQKQLNVTVKMPSGIAGGGYYGAVRFAPASPGGGKQVNLSASVASLILVTVPGKYTEQLSLASFGVAHGSSVHTIFTNGKSLQAVLRFQNGGAVQEQPFGKLILKNFHGKVLSTTEINNTDPRGNVLPDSIRRFNVPLKDVGSFGKYTLEGNFGYGSNGQLISGKTTFYVIPVSVIILVLLVILLILFLIFGLPRLIRGYNRRVIARAGRGGGRRRS